jgi:hypothetical protein
MSSWFRIGQVRTSKLFAFSGEIASGHSLKHLQYVDHPGSITLYGGIRGRGDASNTAVDPYEGNRYSGSALINLLSFDRERRYGIDYDDKKTLEEYFGYDREMPDTFQKQMDKECQKSIFSPTLVNGQWDLQGSQNYMAKLATDSAGNPTEFSDYLPFTGPSLTTNAELQINEASVIGVCYCAMVSESNTCLSNGYWLFAGLTTIRGPSGGAEWTFPTNIVVNVALTGWGLSGCDEAINADCGSSGRDRLRLIDPLDNPGDNPCRGTPIAYQTLRLRCPPSGTYVNSAGATVQCPFSATRVPEADTDIDLLAVTGRNTNATLHSYVGVGNTSSIIQFLNPIDKLLEAGDMITIDPSTVLINGETSALLIDPKQKHDLSRVTGEYAFLDPGSTSGSYWISHKLSNYVKQDGSVSNYMMTIPVGWPVDPIINFTNNEGRWTQRNKVHSRVEIKGTTPASDLRVCWGVHEKPLGSATGTTQYYKEAGTMNFVEPSLMKNAQVDLTAKQNGVI